MQLGVNLATGSISYVFGQATSRPLRLELVVTTVRPAASGNPQVTINDLGKPGANQYRLPINPRRLREPISTDAILTGAPKT
jgi:hypothetical protein